MIDKRKYLMKKSNYTRSESHGKNKGTIFQQATEKDWQTFIDEMAREAKKSLLAKNERIIPINNQIN